MKKNVFVVFQNGNGIYDWEDHISFVKSVYSSRGKAIRSIVEELEELGFTYEIEELLENGKKVTCIKYEDDRDEMYYTIRIEKHSVW